eukprot:TRINITY_DN30246_c0_g1_i1.p1 TRINITY_DN30246_c0_g1~~TRINITY_DN30246_c0_g1_i1.p1  ORF type:complete len:678 (+),score=96.87 TRINITY_DN30246_c0_g1_i1:145-2034(+)
MVCDASGVDETAALPGCLDEPRLLYNSEGKNNGVSLHKEVMSALQAIEKKIDGCLSGIGELQSRGNVAANVSMAQRTSIIGQRMQRLSRRHSRAQSGAMSFNLEGALQRFRDQNYDRDQSGEDTLGSNLRLQMPLRQPHTMLSSRCSNASEFLQSLQLDTVQSERDSFSEKRVEHSRASSASSLQEESSEMEGVVPQGDKTDEPSSPASPGSKGKMFSSFLPDGLQNENMEAFAAMQKRRRSHVNAQLWAYLNDPESSRVANLYSKVSMVITLLSVLITLQQTLEPPIVPRTVGQHLEIGFESFFLFECVSRVIASPSTWYVLSNPFNFIDFLASAPLLLRIMALYGVLALGSYDVQTQTREYTNLDYLLLCIVPVVRLLKTLRNFTKFTLLLSAFQNVFEALPVLLFSMAIISMVFSALIFVCEPRSHIETFPDAVWLSIVTMTTVGYGDVVPRSGPGRLITGCLVVIGSLYMAMPIGIIGNSFTVSWNDRKAILLLRKTRDRLVQWGYTAYDIPVLFSCFSSGAELNYDQFHSMITAMGVGYTDGMVLELFEFCDRDSSGSVDAAEFIKRIFPNMYVSVCGSRLPDDEEGDDTEGRPAGEQKDADQKDSDRPALRRLDSDGSSAVIS